MKLKAKRVIRFAFKKVYMVLYFDTETTSLHPGQICQLSYLMQTKKSVEAKNFFFTVDSVDFSAFMVHGFSVEKLKTLSCGRRFKDYFQEIEKDFSSADVLISHNTAFDGAFMRTEYERLNKVFMPKEMFCSMKKSVPILKLLRPSGRGYKYPKLSELCEYLAVSDRAIKSACTEFFGADAGYHDARFDTCAVFLSMKEYFNKGAFKEIETFL